MHIKIINKYFLILLIISLQACSMLGGGTLLGESELGSPAGNSLTGEGSGSGSGGDEGTVEASPASIPTPNARIDDSHIIHYAADSEGYGPVVASAGSVTLEDSTFAMSDLQVLFTTDDLSADIVTASMEISPNPSFSKRGIFISPFGKGGYRGILSSVIHSAYAGAKQQTSISVDPPTNLCSSPNTCCAIASDGSYECYPTSDVNTAYNSYLVNKDGTLVYATLETAQTPNASLLWFKQQPKDVETIDGSHIYGDTTNAGLMVALGSDTLVPMLEIDNTVTVYGSHASSYAQGDVSGTDNIAYDSSNKTIGQLDADTQTDTANAALPYNNLTDAFLDGTSDAIGQGGNVSVPDTLNFNQIKYTSDGKMRFVRRPVEGERNEFIYALDHADKIPFLDQTFGVYSINTPTFDVSEYSTALALFEADDGTFRLAHANAILLAIYGTDKFGYDIPLTLHASLNTLDPVDLTIYNAAASKQSGDFLLLDKGNNKAWILDFNIATLRPFNATIDTNLHPQLNGVPTGANPVAIAYNADKSKAYILNQGDSTITVLTLKDSSGNPYAFGSILKSTIPLEQFLGGKTVDITANTLGYYLGQDGTTEFLLVGSVDLNGGIVINLSDSNLTIEHNTDWYTRLMASQRTRARPTMR